MKFIPQIILLTAAGSLAAFLYFSPRTVIKSGRSGNSLTESQPASGAASGIGSMVDAAESDSHNEPFEEPAEALSLRKKYKEVSDKRKSIIFADSLVELYVRLSRFDSAIRYATERVRLNPSDNEGLIIAGNTFLAAFDFSPGSGSGDEYLGKAKEYFNQVLSVSPENLDARAGLAMTYLTSENPMEGIGMLRENLAKNPSHYQTLFNLGMLSIRSGQFDKAIARFKTLEEKHPSDEKVSYFLAVSLFESGSVEEAKSRFIKLSSSSNPLIRESAKGYLNQKK